MARKEIQSIALAPCVAAPFAAAWSEDNRISLITERGVHVMEVLPDFENAPPVFELRRTWVEPCQYLPTTKAGFDCDQMIWKMSQRDVFHMVLDTCLAPGLSMAKSAPPHITQVAWSPAGMVKYARCLLASVTNYGCVVVQALWSKQWHTLANISVLWANRWTPQWKKSDDAGEQIDVLRERTEKLKATAITWSNIMDDGQREFSFLIVGLKNGDIVVWRIDAASAIRKKDISPSFMLHFTTDLCRVTTLHWRHMSEKAGWLFVGDVRGVIKLFVLSVSGEQLECVSSTQVWPHADRIQVSQLLALPLDDGTLTVIAAKGGFVVAVALDAAGNVVTACSHLVGNLAVSGIVALKAQTLLVQTHSGCINLLSIVKSGTELRIEVQPRDFLKVPQSAYYGLAASPNKVLFCIVTSLCQIFDHLIQREPAQLTFVDMYALSNPYEVLLSNSLQTLRGNWDYLELARLRGMAFQGLEALDTPDQLDSFSMCKLKILFWLCKFAVTQDFTEEHQIKCPDLKERMTEIEQLILNRSLCSRATELLQQESITTLEQQSLAIMLCWLQKVDAKSTKYRPTQTAVKNVLSLAEKYPSLPERDCCVFCGQEYNEIEDPTEARCPAGHMVPRCCLSLLPCADVPFWFCEVCHTVAHNSLGITRAPICPYCDRICHLDDNFLLPEELLKIEEKQKIIEAKKKVVEENRKILAEGENRKKLAEENRKKLAEKNSKKLAEESGKQLSEENSAEASKQSSNSAEASKELSEENSVETKYQLSEENSVETKYQLSEENSVETKNQLSEENSVQNSGS